MFGELFVSFGAVAKKKVEIIEDNWSWKNELKSRRKVLRRKETRVEVEELWKLNQLWISIDSNERSSTVCQRLEQEVPEASSATYPKTTLLQRKVSAVVSLSLLQLRKNIFLFTLVIIIYYLVLTKRKKHRETNGGKKGKECRNERLSWVLSWKISYASLDVYSWSRKRETGKKTVSRSLYN